MLKYPDEWAFVSLYDGLGGPPIFCGSRCIFRETVNEQI
jgi:hypothetical protein